MPIPNPANDRNRVDNQWLGVALYLLCLALIVLISIVVKMTGSRVPVSQILLFRFAVSLIPLLLIGLTVQRPIALQTSRLRDHTIRSITGIASIGLYFVAIKHIPLATATALSYAAPIVCVVLSIPLLGEKIGVRRWTAALVGFAGVLIISWPGSGVIALGSLAGIGSAIGGALVVIYLRKLSSTEAALTSSLYYNGTGAIVFVAWTLMVGWVPMSDADWAWLIALGLIAGIQQFALAHAFRFAEATLLAPLEYLVLVFAAIAGFVFWGEVPTLATWIGGLIISVSGLFMLQRRRQKI